MHGRASSILVNISLESISNLFSILIFLSFYFINYGPLSSFKYVSFFCYK